jgi:hypothetical protein
MQEHIQPPMSSMPYGYYPSPYHLLPYYPMQASMGLHPGAMGVPPQAGSNLHPIAMQTQSLPSKKMDSPKVIPKVIPWLNYCDRHPNRCGDSLSDYAHKFDQEGYRRVDQLTSNRVSVENLAGWVKIGTGIAGLVIHYADEDMVLVNAGQFSMTLPDDGHKADDGEEHAS